MTTRTDNGNAVAPHRHAVTWSALVLCALVTVALLAAGIRALLRATGVVAIDSYAEIQGGAGQLGLFDEEQLRLGESITAAVALGAGFFCLLLTLGLLRSKQWAREGAMGVFGLGGLVLGLLAVSGLSQDPPGPNADLGLVGSLVLFGIAGLVAAPVCRADFERRRRHKEQARRARRG